MKIHKEIIQGTEEWYIKRWGQIGGTRAKGLFVKSKTLLYELLSEITEDYEEEDNFLGKDMERGQDLEPVALYNMIGYTGIPFESVGWLQSDIPNVGVSPDGISPDGKTMVEIKCPARKKHIEICVEDVVPKDYVHQLLHCFTVNDKLEKLYFCSFRPESNVRPLFVKELTRESVINLGTNAKPVNKTIKEWVVIATENAKKINLEIESTLKTLEF